jgi:predicted amidophosphoribosyltransferase
MDKKYCTVCDKQARVFTKFGNYCRGCALKLLYNNVSDEDIKLYIERNI